MVKENLVVKKRGGGERVIPWHKWGIDRSTSHGEDAELLEYMPHGGTRLIDRCNIIRRELPLEKCECGADVDIWNTYCTSRGHGYTVNCKSCYPGVGPWAKTAFGAERLWNKERRQKKEANHALLRINYLETEPNHKQGRR